MKLFLSLACLAVMAVGGHCSVARTHHGPIVPKELPVEVIIDPLLQRVQSSIKIAESRELSHLQRLESLASILNANLDFRNVYQQSLYPRISLHQKQQNERLDDLEVKIYQINALRYRVHSLRDQANTINDVINNDIYLASLNCRYLVEDLQNVEREINSRIKETQVRADAVNDLIDTLSEKSWDNKRGLLVVKNVQAIITRAVNDQRGAQLDRNQVTLYPNNEEKSSADLPFASPYLGKPQAAFNFLVGFHLLNNPTYYDVGSPSLYFGEFSSFDYERVIVTGTDMSTGPWSAPKVDVSLADIYFGSDTLPDIKAILNN